jgi:hypothetical protein
MDQAYVLDNVGSHIPVLDLVKRLSNIKGILEFGSGIYSTNKLLEFPCLEQLTSYEDSKPWFGKIAIIRDEKFNLVFAEDLLSIARTVSLDKFDLIFIDCCDSTKDSKPERAAVIKAIAERKPKAIVVIHDFNDELERFPKAIENFDNVIVYDNLWPATGILWNQTKGSATIRNIRFEGIQGILDVQEDDDDQVVSVSR